MGKSPKRHAPSEITYELYTELVEELLNPIEPTLDTSVRYELYLSKLVYLENLQEQCFRSINQNGALGNTNSFSARDLGVIQDAIATTHEFMRETILEALESGLTNFGRHRHTV